MARPTKLTPAAEELIVKSLRAGNYRSTAARVAGVHPTTFHRWLERGDPSGADPANQPYREFAAKVDQAIAEAEVREVTRITKAAESDWRAAAWRLARRHPEKWGSTSPPDHAAGATPQRRPESTIAWLRELPDADLEQLSRSLGIEKLRIERAPVEPPLLQLAQAIWDELYKRRAAGSEEYGSCAHDLLRHLAAGGDRDDRDLEQTRDEVAARHGLPPRPR